MLTCDDIRRIALALPEAHEAAHFDATSFRVKGKIFCTMGSDHPRAALKLDPEDQRNLVEAHPDAISPVAGYWGRSGWTVVEGGGLDERLVADLMRMAWARVAPKKLLQSRP
jgi:hypothetical protein